MDTNKLIEIVEKRRKELDISGVELAKRAGVSYRAWLYWKGGEREITLYIANQLLKAVGLQFEICERGENN